ncbi:methionyl-tRNA formyltransferase mitochondrial precursor [Scheffersomyces amazonensis]|uniref:methionyl-tRNA formyltransferase mitochondrial precursor n=1 Tax=Scheffersomyces amazonensis TaxID=1078765 RepID=UPI00315DC7EB
MVITSMRYGVRVLGAVRVRQYSSVHAPLRIAYFGSDDFSVSALDGLVKYQQHHPSKIESIHVVTKKLLPTGRKLRTITELPIGEYSAQNNLPMIRVSNGEDIKELSQLQFSLAIAVSFGVLIPGQFLSSCQYGGINIHPSLLPRYQGASPIQYALMNDDHVTGVTVQTLHPTHFDRGDIVIQSDEVAIEDHDNYSSLATKLGAFGGQLLVDVIDQGLFRPDHDRVKSKYEVSKAPKLHKSASQISWQKHSARQVVQLGKALGPLYTYQYVDIHTKRKKVQEFQRVILSDIKEVEGEYEELKQVGQFQLENERLIVKTHTGYVSVGRVKFQACKEEAPEEFMGQVKKRTGHESYVFGDG